MKTHQALAAALHGGRYENYAWPGIHVRHPGDYVHNVSFGATGIGLATAMGAAVSGAGKPTLLAAGDGSFELGGFSELFTAVQRDMDSAIAMLEPRDFAPVAQAMGVPSMTARTAADLPAVADFLRKRDTRRPCQVHVKLGPEQMHG